MLKYSIELFGSRIYNFREKYKKTLDKKLCGGGVNCN